MSDTRHDDGDSWGGEVLPARVENPFGSAAQVPMATTGLMAVEQQRSIAEVQARMIIARANPRDHRRCMDMIIQDCTRITLAESAVYSYGRGGSRVSGPSIRLAETIARRWGNIASGIKEISRRDGFSECIAYAWDLETGYYDERQFQVRHWRDTKEGGYAITDERDIYEMVANMGQRRKRAVILSVVPGDVIEAAVDQCERTLRDKIDVTVEAIQRMVATFGQFGVTKEQIEKRCQCHLEAIRPAQLVNLRKIYTSLKDGMSDPDDWFEPIAEPAAGGKKLDRFEQQHARQQPTAAPQPQPQPEPAQQTAEPAQQPAEPAAQTATPPARRRGRPPKQQATAAPPAAEVATPSPAPSEPTQEPEPRAGAEPEPIATAAPDASPAAAGAVDGGGRTAGSTPATGAAPQPEPAPRAAPAQAPADLLQGQPARPGPVTAAILDEIARCNSPEQVDAVEKRHEHALNTMPHSSWLPIKATMDARKKELFGG